MTTISPSEALRRSATQAESFGDFYAHHVPKLCAFLARRTCDAEVAMDLTAESFAQAFISRRRFRGSSDGEAAAWLYRIASRQLARYFAKGTVEQRALRRLGIEAPELDRDQQERIEELASISGLREAVRAEVTRLPATQRDALRLRVVEELPYAEVSKALDISEPAARNRVMRGLRALAVALESKPPTEEPQT